MTVGKKIVVVLVMVLSAVLALALVSAAAGTWWLRGEVVDRVIAFTDLADQHLLRVQQVVVQADEQIRRGKDAIDQVATSIRGASASEEQTQQALLRAEQLFQADVAPMVEDLTGRAEDARGTVAAIEENGLLSRILPTGVMERLRALGDTIVDKAEGPLQLLARLGQAIQDARSAASNKVQSLLTAPLDEAEHKLGAMSSELTEVKRSVDQELESVARLRGTIRSTATLVAAGLTVFFLWMALAQASLFVHAYGMFTGRDPLARGHGKKAESGGEGGAVEVGQGTGAGTGTSP